MLGPGEVPPEPRRHPRPAHVRVSTFVPDGSATYTILKSKICQNTDVAGNPADDFTGLCDAVSMGLGFVATPAIQGSNKSAPDSGSPCQGNTDHCQ